MRSSSLAFWGRFYPLVRQQKGLTLSGDIPDTGWHFVISAGVPVVYFDGSRLPNVRRVSLNATESGITALVEIAVTDAKISIPSSDGVTVKAVTPEG